MNQLFAALVSLWIGYKRKKKIKEEEIPKINYFMFAKMKKNGIVIFICMRLTTMKKKCFNMLIILIFSRNAIMY